VEEPIKRSEAVEKEYTQAVIYGIVGLVSAGLTFLFWRYGGMFYSFSWGFGLAWLGSWAYAGWSYYKTRQIPSYPVECPFCKKTTEFTAQPQSDFTCDHCLRRVPIENGRVLDVIAVKCPHCGSTEQVSTRATVVICEQCQREFPLKPTARTQVSMPLPKDVQMPLPKDAPTVIQQEEDNRAYELVLLGVDRHKEERAIQHLEAFLTLNRPDVKKLLESVPMVLLTNLPHRKAHSMAREFQENGVLVEVRVLDDPNRVPTPW